ncbi:MAG: DNA polymerase I [Verrucomicrobiales bacterium]
MKKLFLLDGMALVYRAHFALIQRPIFTSKGVNTSALYGFTQTLLELLNNQKPTHIAVAFDTDAATPRHEMYKEYKSQRQAMPEDLKAALPHVRRMLEAFNIPILECDGCEADDIIATLVKEAEKADFVSYMVTPDKDFGQLVSDKVFLYKPSRMGDGVEVMGVPEILNRWGIQKSEQVIDLLGLMGDVSDNIPGVPGIGEKTASKLITQYGSVEKILAHLSELTPKLRTTLEQNREQALLSKHLATLNCDAPINRDLARLERREWNAPEIQKICVEFEFNNLGKRLFGNEFRAGRGFGTEEAGGKKESAQEMLFETTPSEEKNNDAVDLKTIHEIPHQYRILTEATQIAELAAEIENAAHFAFAIGCSHGDPKQGCITGFAVALEPHSGVFAPVGTEETTSAETMALFKKLFENPEISKTGHDIKQMASTLRWHGISVRGKLFDTMLAHSLIEPDLRHTLNYVAEAFLGYTPGGKKTAGKEMPNLNTENTEDEAEPAPDVTQGELVLESKKHAAPTPKLGGNDPAAELPISDATIERADLALQLRKKLEPMLQEKCQERVFYQIEAELIPALVEMEFQGINVDAEALSLFSADLARQMTDCEQNIFKAAGRQFNLNSPKQLGEILFDVMKIAEKPKKTKTGQYATNEQTLLDLATEHEIVQRILDYRGVSKLKSTYADALPVAIWPKSGRIHTTFNQAITSTGRLQSQDPNLQNIPIRSEQGREIRKAFVPRDKDHLLLAADYSQIELRIIASLSKEKAMIEAFAKDLDIHTATAARVYGVDLELVSSEMRRRAKMVNYGIAYGISAFGLAQRLRIPRKEAADIIDQYFAQYPGIRQYMQDTVEFARQHGYVETITGRRRYIRDIHSRNGTVRAGAERNAINAPIQGTAADMIKIAMAGIHNEFAKRNLRTRLLLQVHDELICDLYRPEKEEVVAIVEDKMRNAIKLDVPIVVDVGIGENWLKAH